MNPSEIRVNKAIRNFAECHRYAIGSQSREWSGKTYVSSWVASAVSGLLNDYPTEPKPDDMVYDRITSDAERADESVHKILAAIHGFDQEHKPEYHARGVYVKQVVGSTIISSVVDAVCTIDGKTVLMAIDTGRMPYAVWIRLALEGWLVAADREIEVDQLASLHVPRVGPRTEQKMTFDMRPFAEFGSVVTQWAWVLNECKTVESIDSLTATPGMHCSRCPIDSCAVRGAPMKE